MLQTLAVPEKLGIEKITKSYGGVVALDGIDLSVRSGEFLTLLGPSGSGKTTLLQIICGLTQPSGGRLVIDGRDCTEIPTHLRDIGVIFQSYALFPHMTVAENVAFPLDMRGEKPAVIARKVAQTLDMVGLGSFARRLPSELSGGQQQRVALARCIVYEPALILMDEPLGALDRKLRDSMQVEIKRLHRDTGATIIFVTHDQEEALALSDRICLMNKASIAQIGTPRDIYSRPASTFVADFIGVSNILRGRIEHGSLFVAPEGSFPAPAGPGLVPGSAVSMILRPEHVRVGPADGAALAGTVTEAIFSGATTKLLVRLDTGMVITVRQTEADDIVALGQRIGLYWRNADAQFLSA